MNRKNSLIQFEQVNEMLDHDEAYLQEFCKAAIDSFSTFQQDFKKDMLARDLDELRKTGHKIKPVAQMLGVQQIIDEYEKAKNYLQEKIDTDTLHTSIQRMNNLCEQVLKEFHQKID